MSIRSRGLVYSCTFGVYQSSLTCWETRSASPSWVCWLMDVNMVLHSDLHHWSFVTDHSARSQQNLYMRGLRPVKTVTRSWEQQPYQRGIRRARGIEKLQQKVWLKSASSATVGLGCHYVLVITLAYWFFRMLLLSLLQHFSLPKVATRPTGKSIIRPTQTEEIDSSGTLCIVTRIWLR